MASAVALHSSTEIIHKQSLKRKRSSIDRFRGIVPEIGVRCWAMLRVYVDDSADEKKERVVTAGAYMGFYPDWIKIGTAWRRVLKKHGLKYFRASEYYSLRGEFQQFRDPVKFPKPLGSNAASAALADLEHVIEVNKVAGISVCIPMGMYNEIRTKESHADEIFNPDAFQTALMTLFKTCAESGRDAFKPSQTVWFYCDDGPLSTVYSELYKKFKADNPGLYPFLHGFTVLDDKKSPQLQTADMMASLARNRFQDWLDGSDKNIHTADEVLAARMKRLKVHLIKCWTREYMMAVLEHERKRRGY